MTVSQPLGKATMVKRLFMLLYGVSVKSAYVHTVWNVGIYDIYPVSLMKVSRLQLLIT